MKNQMNSLLMGFVALFFATSCDMQNNQITGPDGHAKVNVISLTLRQAMTKSGLSIGS